MSDVQFQHTLNLSDGHHVGVSQAMTRVKLHVGRANDGRRFSQDFELGSSIVRGRRVGVGSGVQFHRVGAQFG